MSARDPISTSETHHDRDSGWRASPLTVTVGRAVLVVVLIGWTLPMTGVFVSSFLTGRGTSERGWWTVATDPGFTFENYRHVLGADGSTGGMWDSLLNTIAIAVPATAIPVAAGAAFAYALAWMTFRGRRWCYLGVIALAIVPVQVALIPLFSAYTELGLLEGWLGLWLAHAAFGLPVIVLLLRNAFGAVPAHLVDAAHTDGAGHLATFARVVVPLSVPGIAAVAALQFLLVWNDFLVAGTLLTGPEPGRAPLSLGLAELVRTNSQDQFLLSAATMVTIAVPVVVFFGLQRLIVSAARAATFDS